MSQYHKILCEILEKHLFSLSPDKEIETTVFVEQVSNDYLAHITKEGFVIPNRLKLQFIDEIKEDVLEITRKKIYGSFSLREYTILKSKRKLS